MYKHILVGGSLAYDMIATYPQTFSETILPDKLSHLNVCFVVDSQVKRFGGTAGNIAYNLHFLGESPYVLASLSKYDEQYKERLKSWGVPLDFIAESDVETASCLITTDAAENQIAVFHPGAMGHIRDVDLSSVTDAIMIIAPDNPEMMERYVDQCIEHEIDYLFDPGQALGILSQEFCEKATRHALYTITNEYELHLLTDKLGQTPSGNIITTRGEKGSTVDGEFVDALSVDTAVDPTGCGDAFRAGILYGLKHGIEITKAARIGAALGAACVQKQGTQEHTYAFK